jgi:hypothetical protein
MSGLALYRQIFHNIGSMGPLGALFTGIFGLIMILLFASVLIMWFSAPILLYLIYQKLIELNEKLKKL